ncbi:MAG: DUF1501 domain-containing protein [Calditrichaeota bacterium]|nr:MAG: DUF1501 domain-containing protein [Calditrichota bacterium]
MSEKIDLLSRREFLKQGLTLAAASATVPSFLARTALAMSTESEGALVQSRPGVPDHHVLVVVQLSGGNDGLNTVIPFRQDAYYRVRPTLALPKERILPLNDELGLNPGLAGLRSLYDQGLLGVVQGVGYPNPDRSHFRSMEIWQTGVVDDFQSTGWIGRVFDHTCANQHLHNCSPTLAVSVGRTLNPALRGQQGVGVAVQDAERFYRMTRLYTAYGDVELEESVRPESDRPLDFLRRTAMNAQLSAERIRRAVRSAQRHIDYPKNAFARGLKLIAGMIAGGLDARVYYISLSGFDTHANQIQVHERLLQVLGDGLAAFQQDLENLGQAERVLGMTFSEFGRRVAENGSRGTDHGKAAPMFFFGKPVRAGILGEHPSLDALADGDLRFQIDFRSAYATVLEKWLGVDSAAILGRKFSTLDVI